MTFRGIILDVDGTLVDSNGAHALAWQAALEAHGYHVEYPQLRRLIGMGGDKLLPQVSGVEEDTPEGKKISARRQEIFLEEYLPQLKAFKRVPELVETLQAQGFKLAIASSAKKEELEPLLECAGINDLVTQRTSSDDAAESKPDPHIVQAALEQLNLPAEQVVMIGDTPYDVEAALKAGVAFIGVRCGGWDAEELEGAIAVYDDPQDLLRNLERSPLAEHP